MENLSTFVRTLGNQFIRGRKIFIGSIGLDGKVLDGGNSSGTTGQVLSTTGSAVEWITVGSSNVGEINDLSDVTITSLASGNLLKYNGSEWVNFTNNFLTTSTELSDLSGVGNLSPSNNDILIYNSGSGLWVADSYPTLTEADTLATVTGRGNTTTNSISVSALAATGNVTAASVITPLVSYNGTITVKSVEQIDQGDPNPVIFNVDWLTLTQFSVDGNGYATASTGFKVSGSSGFLKADGTVDTSTYITTAHAAFGVTSTKISNWDTAYGWGDHSGLYDDLGESQTVQDNLDTLSASLGTAALTDSTDYASASHVHSQYATLASPTFTGTPLAPTAASTTNNTQIATTAFVTTAVSNLVGAAPGALDTLDELAAALGDDASFSTTVTTSIAAKLPLAGGTLTGGLIGTTASFSGTVLASNFSGSSSGTNTGDQTFATIGAATRLNYDLKFQPATTGGYGGFTFLKYDGTGAGYLLVKGTSSNDVYTANGITLVADGSWLTLAQRTTNNTGIRFMTGATAVTRMTIASNGDVDIVGDLTADNFSGSSSGTNTGDQTLPTDFVSAASGGTFVGDVTFEGSIEVQGTITESSSIRFKENIKPLEPSLNKVEQLNPVTYNKIGIDEEEIGLIAEEVSALFPEVVTYNEEGQSTGIQYQRLSVILLKAMQELTDRVKKLEKK